MSEGTEIQKVCRALVNFIGYHKRLAHNKGSMNTLYWRAFYIGYHENTK